VDITTTVSGVIDIGTGAIARLNYFIDPAAPVTDFADIIPKNIDIKNDTPVSLTVTPRSGTIRAVP
jgi:hypothetical protein